MADAIANAVHELTNKASYGEENGTIKIQHHSSLHR